MAALNAKQQAEQVAKPGKEAVLRRVQIIGGYNGA